MKNYALLLLVVSASLLSCKKEPLTAASLSGTWKLSSFRGGMVANPGTPIITYNFTNNTYVRAFNGTPGVSGTFTIEPADKEVSGERVNYRLNMISNNVLQSPEIYLNLSRNRLTLYEGDVAFDGTVSVYLRSSSNSK